MAKGRGDRWVSPFFRGVGGVFEELRKNRKKRSVGAIFHLISLVLDPNGVFGFRNWVVHYLLTHFFFIWFVEKEYVDESSHHFL